MTGRGRSSGPAHQHARIKPCRLAGVESAPMRDVWQPEAATRANSRGQSVHHNCRAHTRRVVMWSGRSKLIAPAAQMVLLACVGGVLAMPASVCDSLYTVCDGRRYAAFTSGPCTVLVRARCWRRNHVGGTRPRWVAMSPTRLRSQPLACTSGIASPDGSRVESEPFVTLSCRLLVELT